MFQVTVRPWFVFLICGLIGVASLSSFVYGVTALYKSSFTGSDLRTKRSTRNQTTQETDFVYRHAVHTVSWTSGTKVRQELPKPRDITLEDVFISVKTSKKFHSTRLKVILDTWFNLAPSKIWFFSDSDDDAELRLRTRNHLVNTKCSSSHNRSALCCKMAAEIITFIESKERWFCHFDDDNYVNVPALVRMLQTYKADDQFYLGKPSIQKPLEVINRGSLSSKKKIKFRFATGGAGFCLSRPLAERMGPLVENGELVATCENIRLPDDVTIGYIVEHMLATPLTIIPGFHSHLEPLRLLNVDELEDEISFSYGQYDTAPNPEDEASRKNLINISGNDDSKDPTRFLSLHCHLFPFLCQSEERHLP